jgi:chromosome segregation protein
MRLDFIEIAGFRGFRDRTRFDLSPASVVVTGRNGVGKSTLIDAVDYAFTGTIGKYSVQNAKGGGLADHIWWVGKPEAEEHFVEVGFINEAGDRVSIRRDRGGDVSSTAHSLEDWLGLPDANSEASIAMLARTSIIRDELIAALSLDLPGQARFAAVRDALGAIAGPDYSKRTQAILREAKSLSENAHRRSEDAKAQLGRALSQLTNARSAAERSPDVANAIASLRKNVPDLPNDGVTQASREFLVRRQMALGEIRSAIAIAEANAPAWKEVESDAYLARLNLATQSATDLKSQEEQAQKALEAATALYREESSLAELTAHWAGLIDHGQAIGLVDGHCPLCEAQRSSADFAASIAQIRERLADRGKRLSDLLLAEITAREALERASATKNQVEAELTQLTERRRIALETKLKVESVYKANGLAISPSSPAEATNFVQDEEQSLLNIEHAILTLDASSTTDQVVELERQVAQLRSKLKCLPTRQRKQ